MGLGPKRRQDVSPPQVPAARLAALSAKLLDALCIEMLDVVREAAGAYGVRLRRLVDSRATASPVGKPAQFH